MKAQHVLVSSSQGTSDLWRGSLGLVHRDCSAERTDAQATDETTDCELDPGTERENLDEHPNHEHAALHRHGIATAKPVCSSTSRYSISVDTAS